MSKFSKVSLPASEKAETARIKRPSRSEFENSDGIGCRFDFGDNPNSKYAALNIGSSLFTVDDVQEQFARGPTSYLLPGSKDRTEHCDHSIIRRGGEDPVPIVALLQFNDLEADDPETKMKFFTVVDDDVRIKFGYLEEALGFKLVTAPQVVDQTTALALKHANLPIPTSSLKGIWFFCPQFSKAIGSEWKKLKPGDLCYINFLVKLPPKSNEAYTVIKSMVIVNPKVLAKKYNPRKSIF